MRWLVMLVFFHSPAGCPVSGHLSVSLLMGNTTKSPFQSHQQSLDSLESSELLRLRATAASGCANCCQAHLRKRKA